MNNCLRICNKYEARADSTDSESDWSEWFWIEEAWRTTESFESAKWRSKSKIDERILIADDTIIRRKSQGSRIIRRSRRWTNALKTIRRLNTSRNASNHLKRFARKIQRTCNCLLIRRNTNSKCWKSLLNQRMSCSLYYSRRNILMK